MASFRLTVFFIVASLALAKSQLYNVIDTLEDLVSTSGWQLECTDGYQANVSSFRCNRHAINLPGEDLDGEVGFWTGCSGDCLLTYTLRTTDESFGFRAYLKNMQMIVRKNDHVSEYVSGEGWVDWDLDLAYTRSITLRLPHTTGANAFVVLDKVFIGTRAATTQPTTTIFPSTAEPTTTASTPEPPTAAPTPEPTTLPPTPEPTTLPPTPEPTTLPPTLEPTTLAPTPDPTTLAPTPEPTTLAPTPEPTTLAPTPEPTTVPPTPEPTTVPPTPEPTTVPPTPEPTTMVITQQPTTIQTTQGPTTVVDIETTTLSSPLIEVLKRHHK